MNQYIYIIIIILLLIFLFILILQFHKNKIIKLDTKEADIVIIGGGTAGCILARRLNETLPNHKIILLERGQDFHNNPIVYNIANAGIAAYTNPFSEVLKADNPNVLISIGTMYGGGSSHNYALVVHGSPEYYNNVWKKQLGLSYSDIIPYIKKVETYIGTTQNRKVRGDDGKLQVYQLPINIKLLNKIIPFIKNEFSKGFLSGLNTLNKTIDTVKNIGPLRASDDFSKNMVNIISQLKSISIVEDYNANIINCASINPQLFVDNITGLRSSTDVTYLNSSYINKDNFGNGIRNNLQIVANATVNKFNNKEIEWIDKDGKLNITKLSQNGHIILCAGAVYSPYLLLKSGFKNNNIGKNLRTHYGCTMIVSVNSDKNEDFNFSSGPVAFVPKNTNNTAKRDWQIICGGSALLNKKLLNNVGIDHDLEQKNNPNLRYFVFLLWIMDPKTRGLISIDPKNNNMPKIELKLFEDGDLKNPNSDLSNIVDGLKFLYSIVQNMNKIYPSLRSIYPPETVFRENNINILANYVKDGISLTDHYSGTCGFNDVVNPNDFSIYGSSNIHVVDASILSLPDGNTEFPVCVLAEIAADRITKNIK